jgi:hypothetical protein
MKRKKYDPDFFKYAKDEIGEKRFSKAVKIGGDKANKIRLKMAREMIGLNQTDLKGITQPEASKIEGRKDMKISTLSKYAKALGMRVRISLVSEKDEKKSIRIYG